MLDYFNFSCQFIPKAPHNTPDLVGCSREVPAIPKVSEITNLQYLKNLSLDCLSFISLQIRHRSSESPQ